MALRNIRKGGDAVLRRKAAPVSRFNDQLGVLLDDMVETMNAAEGAGLAAPQIGISRRIIIFRNEDMIVELINPEFTSKQGEIVDLEGCLSCPGVFGEVARPQVVRVKGYDRQGRPLELEGEGFIARVLEHEIDHLDGILFVDKALRLLTAEELQKLHGED
ncbi:MAG: peptide deformylase [Bacillota bacterium]